MRNHAVSVVISRFNYPWPKLLEPVLSSPELQPQITRLFGTDHDLEFGGDTWRGHSCTHRSLNFDQSLLNLR